MVVMLRTTLSLGALAFLGFVVGVVGTAAHRFEPYWGSAMVLTVVLAGATYARTWGSWSGLIAFTQVWVVTVLYLYFVRGPGGSVVIVDDALGKIWLFGGALAAILPAFIPRRFVTE